jgi:hypothetical protein
VLKIRLFALLLAAAALLATAVPALAVSRDQAADKALAALGSRERSGPVVVFGLTTPLRSGARIAERSRLVLRVRGERSFFFYEDSGTGRVALVGAKSGKVTLSKTLRRAPLIDGRLPAFLTTVKRYRSARYRVFSRSSGTPADNGGAPALSGGLSGPDGLLSYTGTSGLLSNFGDGSLFGTIWWCTWRPEGSQYDIVLPLPDALRDFLLAHVENARCDRRPEADAQDVRVKRNRPKSITLTASDADGEALTFAITKQPKHGTLSGQPPNVTYTPHTNYLGKDEFTFKANDGEFDSEPKEVEITVVPVGSPPTVTTSSGCTAYTERNPAVAVDPLINVSDPDDTTLASARARISGSFVEGDDLVFTDQNGISSSYDDTTGVLTLTGTASVANYRTALGSVRYRNLGNGSPSPTKSIQFTANDGGTDSAPATKQICIAEGGGSTKPVGEASEGALQYTENDGPVPIDSGFTAQDQDSSNLSGATVRFIATQGSEEEELPDVPTGTSEFNFFPGQDVLAYVGDGPISGSYDSETGVLTLTGTATVAEYEAALRSVTYQNTSEDPSESPRTIRFQVTDSSAANSKPSSRGIFVAAVNDAPVVTATEAPTPATGADPSVTIDSGLTAIDVDDGELESGVVRIASGFAAGDELVFADQSGISGDYDADTGVLTLTGTATVAEYQAALRSVEYSHPDGNPSGARTIEFTANDGELDSPPASKTLALNDAPVLDTTDAALDYTAGDGAVPVDSGITVSDADSTTLAGATIQVTENFSSSEDELTFTNQLGITGFYDDETNTLFLSGPALVEDYETALRAVTYENTSGAPSTATRTVQFRVDDGDTSNNLSEPATRDVEVSLPDQAPVVTTTAGPTTYDAAPVAIDSGVTVTDADDPVIESAQVRLSSGYEAGDQLAFTDQLDIVGAYDPDTGILTLTGPAPVGDYQTALQSIEYSSTGAGPTGPKTVEFTVNDGELDSAAASKTIDIAAPPPLD